MANALSKPLEGSTINSETEKIPCETETKIGLQTFRVALAIDSYTLRDQLIGKPFRSKFRDNLSPIAFLNYGIYIRHCFGVVRKEGPLS